LPYYVMPDVAGDSLRARLDREHQLPIDEAVRIATKMAEALDYAHRQGVIHRDIKPANVLTLDGEPVISDFGIALAVGVAGAGRLTETGMSLGTPHYMSPEQATGDQHVGPATDVWALGCVLYEMLVGEPPYTGSTPQAILGRIITGATPSASAERSSVPPNVDAAIRRALEKLPADRFTGAAGFLQALGNDSYRFEVEARRTKTRNVAWSLLPLTLGLVAGVLAVSVVWLIHDRDAAIKAPPARFTIEPPKGYQLATGQRSAGVAISPQGERVAYLAYDIRIVGESPHQDAVAPGVRLLMRRMESLSSEVISGTEGAQQPFFSPDGRWVGFWQGGMIRKVSVEGGPVADVAMTADFLGAAWMTNGDILYSDGARLWRVTNAGGRSPKPVRFESQGDAIGFPALLPDETAVIVALGTAMAGVIQEPRLAVVAIESGEVRELGVRGTRPHVLGSGFLIYQPEVRVAVLNVTSLTDAGPGIAPGAVPVEEALEGISAVSEAGTLAFLRRAGVDSSQLVWVSRDGGSPTPAGSAGSGLLEAVRISPDGSSIAGSGNTHVWARRLAGGPVTEIASGAGKFRPSWSPDSGSLVFVQDGSVYARPADAARTAEHVYGESRPIGEAFLTSDGRLIYRTDNISPGRGDILAWDLEGSAEPVELIATEAEEVSPALSPDGRWLAYVSDQTGRREVYIRPFPDVDRSLTPVSSGGGVEPVWANDGEELFFRNERQEMVVVSIAADRTLTVGAPQILFSASGYALSNLNAQYDVSPDDTRLLMIREFRSSKAELVVVQSFASGLRDIVSN